MYNVWVSFAIFLSWFLPTPHPLWWQPWSTRRHMSWFGNSYPWRFCLSRTTGFFYRTKSSDDETFHHVVLCFFFGLVGIYLCCFFWGELKAWFFLAFLGILCLLYWWFIHGWWDGIAIPAAIIKQYQLAQYYSICKSVNLGCFTLHRD